MARVSRADWLKEGFLILAEFNQDKIRILYLCERLGVTRGSFYHHFDKIETYITQLMEEWEHENTMALIKAANMGETPLEKFKILNINVMSRNQAIEAAIRSWSFYHEIVKKHLERVDKTRLAYLAEIFIQMGKEKKEAEKFAQLEYALLIGIQQLFPAITLEEMLDLFEVYNLRNPFS